MCADDRLEIGSPVTVGLRVLTNGQCLEFGRLRDIGERGARFTLSRPLNAGTPIKLLVHFRDPYEQVVTLSFKAVVTAAQRDPPHEITVQFRGGPRFYRGDLNEMSRHEQKELKKGCGSGSLDFKRGKSRSENPFVTKYLSG